MFEALQSFAEHDNVITDFSLAVELVQVGVHAPILLYC
jgi:hypothetical protein